MYRTIARHLAVGIVLASMLLTSCDKTTKPSSDATPPVLKWHIENQSTNVSTDIVGSGSFSAKQNETLRVTLKAEDSEGVSYIELGGGYVVSCQAGDAATNASGGYTTDVQTLAPDAQGNVLTLIFLIRTITPDVTCPGGLSFVKTIVSLNGTSRNYFSGETKSTLTLNITP